MVPFGYLSGREATGLAGAGLASENQGQIGIPLNPPSLTWSLSHFFWIRLRLSFEMILEDGKVGGLAGIQEE